MCGIAGVWRRAPTDRPCAGALGDLRGMLAALAPRGPDGEGVWVGDQGRLALGQRRLAIIDPTPAGAQPMHDASGTLTIVYNGEIYNHGALRDTLHSQGRSLRGRSDTAALIESIATLGLDDVLPRLRGMAAFALWDSRARTLTLVRDPMGIKPLQWVTTGSSVAFASDLGALMTLPWLARVIDPAALAAYLHRGAVPAPLSLLRDVRKLLPGEIVTVNGAGDVASRRYAEPSRLWRGVQPLPGDDGALIEAVEAAVVTAVRRERVADVPVGSFLSGGIDSSLITALLRRETTGTLATFSIGFPGATVDESDHAARVARHIGTEHTAVAFGPAEAARELCHLATAFPEPVADMAALPLLLLSRVARGRVTVALSGDGGDELFAGYERYAMAARLGRMLLPLPQGLRALAARALERVQPMLAPLADSMANRGGTRLARLAELLPAPDALALYRTLHALWPRPPVREGTPPATSGPPALSPPALFRAVDLMGYLPDTLLTKTDLASMAAGLEVRVPLLDEDLAALAFSLPERALRRQAGGASVGKWVLREVLYRHVPRALVERPKQGFQLPMGDWLRGPLRPWAEERLDPLALATVPLLDPAPIRRRWQAHCDGQADWSYPLWAILVLMDWQARWRATIA